MIEPHDPKDNRIKIMSTIVFNFNYATGVYNNVIYKVVNDGRVMIDGKIIALSDLEDVKLRVFLSKIYEALK